MQPATLPPRRIGVVEQKYRDWIDLYYPSREMSLHRCMDATKVMQSAFPELTRVRGYYGAADDDTGTEH